MTLHNNTFSLLDLKRNADKIQIFDESMIDDDGNIIPFVDQVALVTHYLQLKDSGVSIPYAQKAQDILDSWTEFIAKTNNFSPSNSVSESNGAYQQYLFPDLFHSIFPKLSRRS